MSTKYRLAAVGILAVAILFVASGPASARDVVHRCSFWSWTGPVKWTAVCGKQGITVSSPDGRRVIDWGFSGLLCVPAATMRQSAAAYIGGQRAGLRRSGVRFRKVGPLRLTGENSFRQVNAVAAGKGRRAVRGQAIFDYSLIDPYGGYCHQSSRMMTVPARNFRRGLRQLKQIYRSMAYFGPGA